MEEQLTKEGFEKLWLNLVGQGFGHMKAYDIAEELHQDRYGHRRYSSYYSFAQSRSR